MLPAERSYLSLIRTSVREVQDMPAGKKNEAASSAISHSWRKRTGQVNYYFTAIINATNSKWIFSFVFGTGRYFIVERPELISPVSFCFR